MSSSDISVVLEPLSCEGITFSNYAMEDQAIGVLVSGEVSQGMNAVVYAVIRMGLHLGSKVYIIYDGYEGLVKGGECIVEATWKSVSNVIRMSGTAIGTSVGKDFCKEKNYCKAALNLIANNLTNLVVIGGINCLIKAKNFWKEWSSLVNKLVNEGILGSEKLIEYDQLNIACIMDSLENDLCGTDISLGTNSALHRILEAIDSVVSVSFGCNRTLVFEIVGQYKGNLALNAALASEADFLFIPEWAPRSNWDNVLCKQIEQKRSLGQNLCIIIVAEGTRDRDFKLITSELIKSVIHKNFMEDVQITTLGHLQNSGTASAFDRILGLRLGTEAVSVLLEAAPYSEPLLISLDGNQPVRISLHECMIKKQLIVEALKEKQWLQALNLCGRAFKSSLIDFRKLTVFEESCHGTDGYTLAVMHVGESCCGMNAAVWSFVHSCIFKGNTVLGIYGGFEGFLDGNVKIMQLKDVAGWVCQEGAFLESSRMLPDLNMRNVAARIKEFAIQALMVIGGFEAYQAVLQIAEKRHEYQEFCIPMIVIPAATNNNVPGTDVSLGSDTALNIITKVCDRICQETGEANDHVHVVETPGRYCGYLTSMSGLAAGADTSYIFEEPFSFKNLIENVFSMQEKIAGGCSTGLILSNGMANSNYTSDFIFRLFSEEGKGIFNTKLTTLVPFIQGSTPSALDRLLGIKMAVKGCEWLISKLQTVSGSFEKELCKSPSTAVVLGLSKRRFSFTPVQTLKMETDFKHQIPRKQWWVKLRPMLKALASPVV